MRGALDAMNTGLGGGAVPKDYFLSLYDDPIEAEALYNLHADRVSQRKRPHGNR